MYCPFCAIATGANPASVVHEDEHVIAFMDIAPLVPGHVLVVPREHSPGLAELDPVEAGRVMVVAHRVAGALRAAGLADGVTLLLSDGPVAGQEVPHAHLHVLPRTEGDGLRIAGAADDPGRTVLDAQAATLRAVLDRPVVPS